MNELRGGIGGACGALVLLACSGAESPPPRLSAVVSECKPGDAPAASVHAVRLSEPDSIPTAERILLDLLADGAEVAADVGDGDFTIELWLEGDASAQIRPEAEYRAPGERESTAFDWVSGNIFLDRSVWSPAYPVFGASFHRDGDPGQGPEAFSRAVVRFGVRSGTRAGGGTDARYTLQGRRHVLDGAWHHVALVRDAARGRLAIYVDGALDAESAADGAATRADLSYPAGAERDDSVKNALRSPLLVIGTEKHDLGRKSPGFSGLVDELRVWRVARSAPEVAAGYRRILHHETPGLAAYYRMEEGSGRELEDRRGGRIARLAAPAARADAELWAGEGAPVACEPAAP
jgi:hypothetical protein